jgi:putative NADH-flavin reductase
MKIALIGSTGFVGRALLPELLQRGHQVTAVVRQAVADPVKLPPQQGLNIAMADAMNADAICAAVRGHEAVVSAFNPGWHYPDLYEKFMRGSGAIVRGVQASGVKRLLVVGGAGSLYVAPGVQLVDTPLFAEKAPAHILPGARAARDALTAIRGNAALDWTFLSPPAYLEEGPRTGAYRTGGEDLLMASTGPAGISVADMAIAIVDELEQPQHVRARFTVASVQ